MILPAQKPKPKTFASLTPGDPAPWFHQRSGGNPNYAFDTVGGRWIVMCFYGTAGDEDGKRALAAIAVNRALFDDYRACFFGVSLDPNDEAKERVADSMPGLRYLLGFRRHRRAALWRDLPAGRPQPQAAGDAALLGRDRPDPAGPAGGAVPAQRQRDPGPDRLPQAIAGAGPVRRHRGAGPGPHPARRVRARILPAADRDLRGARRPGIRLHARGRRQDGRDQGQQAQGPRATCCWRTRR